MGNDYKIGVFLCQCGGRVSPAVDLAKLTELIMADGLVAHCQTLPFTCQAPGLAEVKKAVAERGVNRLIVAGCESRLMAKKFEEELAADGLQKGQIEVVNLRDHVASVHDLAPEALAEKGARLILAAAAGLAAMTPSVDVKVDVNGPVMIVGGGIASYAAAHELASRGVEAIMTAYTDNIWDELRMLHEHYPGERLYYPRLEQIMQEVEQSPLVRRITVGELSGLLGRTGDYTVSFANPDGGPARAYQAGAVIACLDGEMQNQGSDFGHDGVSVICHTEAEELFWVKGTPKGRYVFWINDYEAGLSQFAYLSSRAAWNMARYVRENNKLADVTILYNHKMQIPLSASERKHSRELEVKWLAYDGALRPTVQAGYLTYCDPADATEKELAWDRLVLSPRRAVGLEARRVAEILGLHAHDNGFLLQNHAKVRPEMHGRDETPLAGSASYPCDLSEALRQGRRVAQQIADIYDKAKAGELFAPRMVCVVDESKCIGCGLCKEICDCGGIEPVQGRGGNIPRHVDPMLCTGGGTCAAACPYHALTLQNNSTAQREARAGKLAAQLGELDVLAYGCAWGGLAAADNAGAKGLAYDPRLHLLPVGCIGQLDPSVLARAFLDGANGVLLLGCPPESCHHSYGLDHTWSRVSLLKKLLGLCGFDRRRIALAHCDMNQPSAFINSVNAFLATIEQLGPIERTPQNVEKLQGVYDTVNNSRVRWVLGASLRRPWEEVYPGDQRNALNYDRDLLGVIGEELIASRVRGVLQREKRPMPVSELVAAIAEKQEAIMDSLREMVSEGLIHRQHKDGEAIYTVPQR